MSLIFPYIIAYREVCHPPPVVTCQELTYTFAMQSCTAYGGLICSPENEENKSEKLKKCGFL